MHALHTVHETMRTTAAHTCTDKGAAEQPPTCHASAQSHHNQLYTGCRNAVLRILAPCTLRGLHITGAGVASRLKFRFTNPALVEICGPRDPAAAIPVALERVSVDDVGRCNGVRVRNAARATLRSCSVERCLHNALVVKVCGALPPLSRTGRRSVSVAHPVCTDLVGYSVAHAMLLFRIKVLVQSRTRQLK